MVLGCADLVCFVCGWLMAVVLEFPVGGFAIIGLVGAIAMVIVYG